jgi:hypothetical protein
MTNAVIGFDFGTSCSKVIIHVNEERYAINFSKVTNRKDYPYFLPTRLFLTESESFSLSEGKYAFPDIKLNLINNPDLSTTLNQNSVTSVELVMAYLALAFQQVRTCFFEETPHYQNDDLVWSVNLGMPARSYDNKKLYHALFVALASAWEISFKQHVSLEQIKTTHKDVINRINFEAISADKEFYDNKTDASFAVFPEVIAQIVGYAKSHLRIEGLHLLIDVGASTLDLATFNIYHTETEDDLFPIFVSEIERLGALMLHKHRISCLEKEHGFTADFEIKDFSAIPSKYQGYDLTRYDEKFLSRCTEFIQRGIIDTRNNRHPNAQAWRNGMRVFLCGGGSQMSKYRDLIGKINRWFYRYTHERTQFNIIDLPKPENINVTLQDYHRLSVAYGLSFSSFDIGEVRLPSEIPDLPREAPAVTNETTNWRDRFVGNEQL